MPKKKAAPKKTKEVDFSDEESVLHEIALELDIDPNELEIDDRGRGFSSFGAGTVYEITIKGGKEWCVVENEDQERELALAVVKQDLEESPENFDNNFIESHINIDRLRDYLKNDVIDSAIDRLTDDAERRPDDFWEDYERAGLIAPEADDEGELPEPEQSHIEELAEHQANHKLRDPMDYLRDIYGNDAVKQAIQIAGIDIDAAAEEAVDTDGPAHFLSSYDGRSYTTKSGLVYWRVEGWTRKAMVRPRQHRH
jgi:hypothetical protein